MLNRFVKKKDNGNKCIFYTNLMKILAANGDNIENVLIWKFKMPLNTFARNEGNIFKLRKR
jgi:hypothetical protein